MLEVHALVKDLTFVKIAPFFEKVGISKTNSKEQLSDIKRPDAFLEVAKVAKEYADYMNRIITALSTGKTEEQIRVKLKEDRPDLGKLNLLTLQTVQEEQIKLTDIVHYAEKRASELEDDESMLSQKAQDDLTDSDIDELADDDDIVENTDEDFLSASEPEIEEKKEIEKVKPVVKATKLTQEEKVAKFLKTPAFE